MFSGMPSPEDLARITKAVNEAQRGTDQAALSRLSERYEEIVKQSRGGRMTEAFKALQSVPSSIPGAVDVPTGVFGQAIRDLVEDRYAGSSIGETVRLLQQQSEAIERSPFMAYLQREWGQRAGTQSESEPASAASATSVVEKIVQVVDDTEEGRATEETDWWDAQIDAARTADPLFAASITQWLEELEELEEREEQEEQEEQEEPSDESTSGATTAKQKRLSNKAKTRIVVALYFLMTTTGLFAVNHAGDEHSAFEITKDVVASVGVSTMGTASTVRGRLDARWPAEEDGKEPDE